VERSAIHDILTKSRLADKPGSVATNRRWSFLWDRNCLRPQAIYPRVKRNEPLRGQASLASPLFDLASSGVYLAELVTQPAGGLLLHRFTLTLHLRARRFTFCGTVPSLSAGRRYRPLCPAKPGLSSASTRPAATIWPTDNLMLCSYARQSVDVQRSRQVLAAFSPSLVLSFHRLATVATLTDLLWRNSALHALAKLLRTRFQLAIL
jgi:hypothetical protein